MCKVYIVRLSYAVLEASIASLNCPDKEFAARNHIQMSPIRITPRYYWHKKAAGIC